MKNEADIIQVLQEDGWIMDILKAAKSLDLPDWWVCAGFVRSKIWDVLHGYRERTPIPDIDVIYFDPFNIDKGEEKRLEEELKTILPNLPWSVKNQARMHLVNGNLPYSSAVEAISKFPEIVTAVGIKLDEADKVVLTAPYGVHDLLNLQVRPTPHACETKERAAIYEERMRKKNWKSIWDRIDIVHVVDKNG